MKQIIITSLISILAISITSAQTLKLDVIGDGSITGKLKLTDTNQNLFLGELAGQNSLSDGNFNIGIGYKALHINGLNTNNDFTADNNVAIGYETMSLNQNGDDNVAIGFQSMLANIMGSKNVAIGREASSKNTQGDGNIAIGFRALKSSTQGMDNIAIGTNTLELNEDEDGDNIAIGGGSMANITSGFSNVGIGSSVYALASDGSSNVFVGDNAAGNSFGGATGGDGNICIGANTELRIVNFLSNPPTSIRPVNQIVIGEGATAAVNNTAVIGNSNIHSVYMNEDGTANVVSSSDRRMKKDILESDMGLNFIMNLKPVKYKWKKRSEFPSSFINERIDDPSLLKVNPQVQYGFIAQEVKMAMNKYNIDWQGWSEQEGTGRQGLNYSAFVVPLVKAVQEQQNEISDLKKEVKSLQKTIEIILLKINS